MRFGNDLHYQLNREGPATSRESSEGKIAEFAEDLRQQDMRNLTIPGALFVAMVTSFVLWQLHG